MMNLVWKPRIWPLITVLLISTTAMAEDIGVDRVTTVIDDLGRVVSLAGAPERIVSLSPANTEILFALGLDSKVVGVTTYCNYPPKLESLKDQGEIALVGGFIDPDLEKILSLVPDLVLASNIHSDNVVFSLEKEGIPTFVVDPDNVSSTLLSIEKIGRITGKTTEAIDLTNEMRSRIHAISDGDARLPAAKVLYIVWIDPVRTAGTGTFEDEIIEEAGGVNLFHDLRGYAQVDPEAIVLRNPEVIITCADMGDGNDRPFLWAETYRILNQTDARRKGRIFKADGDIVSRTGPRIVDALEIFARFIHSEAN
jgi:iron complex transport system substrate-binding protein